MVNKQTDAIVHIIIKLGYSVFNMISVIIPFLDEKQVLPALLAQLKPVLDAGHEIILIDGGSTDGFCPDKNITGISLYMSEKGRAQQMNLGAQMAKGDVFWFLHADTILVAPVMDYVNRILEGGPSVWGRFNIEFTEDKAIFLMIGFMMNIRSALSGIATGDQGIFVCRDYFNKVGCYDDIEIMEDILLSKKLKKMAAPINIKTALITSSRRWRDNGILKTIMLMWWMRFLFFVGVKPSRLIKMYEK